MFNSLIRITGLVNKNDMAEKAEYPIVLLEFELKLDSLLQALESPSGHNF